LPKIRKKRPQRVILARIRDRDRPEFRADCRLARAVTAPEFQKPVAAVAGPPRHAQWVLDFLKYAPVKR
jgi:hypothetical protein